MKNIFLKSAGWLLQIIACYGIFIISANALMDLYEWIFSVKMGEDVGFFALFLAFSIATILREKVFGELI